MALPILTPSNTLFDLRTAYNSTAVILNNLGTYNAINITGGTIDGVVIGGSNAAIGTFSNLEVTSTLDISTGTLLLANDALSGDIISGGTIDDVMIELSGVPSLTNHATTKAYVDGLTSLASLSTVGTIGTGVWNGTLISGQYGGTGVNNSGKTITLGGNLTTSGAYATTLTVTGATNVTLPTTGTLVNTAVTTLSSLESVGTITTGTWNATTIALNKGGTGATDAAGARTALGGTATGVALFTAAAASNARTTLELGTAAIVNTGTSGTTIPLLDGTNSWSAPQRGTISTLSDGATVTPNFNTANNFTWTIGGNRTLANPSNQTAGQSGVIFIIQNGSGNNTITWGSNWLFPNGNEPALSTAPNAKDMLYYFVQSSGNIFCNLVRAFS